MANCTNCGCQLDQPVPAPNNDLPAVVLCHHCQGQAESAIIASACLLLAFAILSLFGFGQAIGFIIQNLF
jgi:hypothetical protein